VGIGHMSVTTLWAQAHYTCHLFIRYILFLRSHLLRVLRYFTGNQIKYHVCMSIFCFGLEMLAALSIKVLRYPAVAQI